MYHQWRDDSLSPDVWKRWEATLGWWLSHPGMRAWWKARPTSFSADFDTFAEQMIRDIRFDAEAISRWRKFVAGTDLATKAKDPVAAE